MQRHYMIPDGVREALADAHRREWARVLAATVRVTRDLDLVEECTQDAYTHALSRWAADGIPDRPGAWLTTVARNRALDALRRASVLRRTLPLLVMEEPATGPAEDDLLRLIFTCCHPALAADARVALTLRLLCGAVHRRGGPRVPGPAHHDGGPDHPRQEEDRRGPDPVPGARAR